MPHIAVTVIAIRAFPAYAGKVHVWIASDGHLIGKQGPAGRPPARSRADAPQPAQPEAQQERPVIARDVRMMER